MIFRQMNLRMTKKHLYLKLRILQNYMPVSQIQTPINFVKIQFYCHNYLDGLLIKLCNVFIIIL